MMKYSLSKLSFILLLFFVTFNSLAAQLFEIRAIELNDKLYQLEIADTNRRKTQGLMYRKTLDQSAGMLFVYNQPGDYRIWMKNTLIPLTVIWLDEQARIIDKKILQPCRSSNCPVSAASKPSKFIIELHPDEFDRYKQGDQLPQILLWNRKSR